MSRKAVAPLLALLLAASAAGAGAEERLVTLEGKVLDARDGSPVAKADVILRQAVTTTVQDGSFVLAKLVPSAPVSFRSYRPLRPEGRDGEPTPTPTVDPKKVKYEYFDQTVPSTFAILWVNAELQEVNGTEVRKFPAYGWKVVDLSSPAAIEIRVGARDPEGEFCRGCHAENEYVSRATVKADKPWPVPLTEQVFTDHRFRDLHPTGFDHKKSATSRGLKFVLDPVGVDLLDGRKATCFTCHTPHVPTPNRGFVKGEYEAKGEFCRRCHR